MRDRAHSGAFLESKPRTDSKQKHVICARSEAPRQGPMIPSMLYYLRSGRSSRPYLLPTGPLQVWGYFFPWIAWNGATHQFITPLRQDGIAHQSPKPCWGGCVLGLNIMSSPHLFASAYVIRECAGGGLNLQIRLVQGPLRVGPSSWVSSWVRTGPTSYSLSESPGFDNQMIVLRCHHCSVDSNRTGRLSRTGFRLCV